MNRLEGPAREARALKIDTPVDLASSGAFCSGIGTKLF